MWPLVRLVRRRVTLSHTAEEKPRYVILVLETDKILVLEAQ